MNYNLGFGRRERSRDAGILISLNGGGVEVSQAWRPVVAAASMVMASDAKTQAVVMTLKPDRFFPRGIVPALKWFGGFR